MDAYNFNNFFTENYESILRQDLFDDASSDCIVNDDPTPQRNARSALSDIDSLSSTIISVTRGYSQQTQQQPENLHPEFLPANVTGSEQTPVDSPPKKPLTEIIAPLPCASLVNIQDSDTRDTLLPLLELGARQLIESLFSHAEDYFLGKALPPNSKMHLKPEEIGLPLPVAREQVDLHTGRRLVYFDRREPPVSIFAEPRSRFIAVVSKLFIDNATNDSGFVVDVEKAAYTTSYGTVLGYSDDNTAIVWHERSKRFASWLPICSILRIQRSSALRCKHCGLVFRRPELREHIATHKKGSGVLYGVFADDANLGNVCGDSGLLQNLTSPKPLGQGGQGLVQLFDIIQPTQEEEVLVGKGSAAYNYVCRQFTPHKKLCQAVVKTVYFDNTRDAWQQYERSVRFMAMMNHLHLVEYLAVQLKPDHKTLRLVMPYYEEGDLATAIKGFRGDHFDESFVCSIALQLSLVLEFLHERNPPIVHGDIKPENIMFYNNKQQVVLMDLDASCEMGVYNSSVYHAVGTTAYMAPETLIQKRLMPASDMWSLGVVLYILTVLPDFPMILNPVTLNMDLLNAEAWATPDDVSAMSLFNTPDNIALRPSGDVSQTNESPPCTIEHKNSITLAQCVHANVSRKAYSKELTQLIVDLLSYNPHKRPTAADVSARLTEIMANLLLHMS